MTVCPDCGSQLHAVRSGGTLLLRCLSSSCDWGVVTTFPVPIFKDGTRYRILIPPLPDATPALLIALNQKFAHGITETRRLAKTGELPSFEGSALEVWDEALRLHDAGVPFQIQPDYPFDLDAPETAFGPTDGPLDDGMPGD